MHGEHRLNIKTQLIISALKFSEFPDHISIDYVYTQSQVIFNNCNAKQLNRNHPQYEGSPYVEGFENADYIT